MWYEIFKFEIQYRARRTETYVFFAVIFLFSMIAFDFIYEGQDLGKIKENAPLIIAKIMCIETGFFMLVVSMIMGIPVLRDFEHQMESLLFVNPIRKWEYLLGRFLGSFVVLVLIFSGLILGLILGEMMPWRNEETLLPFSFWHYINPFLLFVLPSLFVGGSLFFTSGALSRNMILVYTQGLVFLLATVLSHFVENDFIATLLDPLCISAIDDLAKTWNVETINNSLIPLKGNILYNRLFWTIIALVILAKGYKALSYNVIKEQPKTKLNSVVDVIANDKIGSNQIPFVPIRLDFITICIQLKSHTLFYFHSILKEAAFWAIVICAVITIFVNTINVGTTFGVNSLPTTYLILEELKEMSIYFFLMILIFYPGELIWRESKIRMDGIVDSLPISNFVMLGGKFFGLLLTYLLLLLILMFSGILFQTFKGYFHFQLEVYFVGLFVEVFPFLAFFTCLTFFFQIISNSKFIGQILVVVFFVSIMVLSISGYGHGLYVFGGIPLQAHSDMNGYGHFLKPFLWFKLYWLSFCVFLFALSTLLLARGEESNLLKRMKLMPKRGSRALKSITCVAVLSFVILGSFIFYNTNNLNRFLTFPDQNQFRADYEKTLKKYALFNHPNIVGVNLNLSLYPKKRTYKVGGYYLLENHHDESIHEIHIQQPISNDEVLTCISMDEEFEIITVFEKFGYHILKLSKPLLPGAMLEMDFEQESITKGFTEDNNETTVVWNGTFFDNDRFPSIGYNSKYELNDKKDRKYHGLAEKNSSFHLSEVLQQSENSKDKAVIDFEMTISTAKDQIAIAPGTLLDEWTLHNRRYFYYKMNHPMINFYSIVSARYDVLRDVWVDQKKGTRIIDLEIYHHKNHDRNITRMMNAMHRSLDYFTKHFGCYPYGQLRIMEIPRYNDFAQSFPTTIPYAENVGFMLEIDDEKDVDIPFFITAHEVAHQWWGIQLVAVNVPGKLMLLETLAQYSALMVLKHEFGEAKVHQLLQFEKEKYLAAQLQDPNDEVPLSRVEDQEYIYYSKGAINMYAFQKYISEDSVNVALHRFLEDWNVFDGEKKGDQLPTTNHLLDYLKAVTPDSLEYVVEELFEEVCPI